jgi:hypothetical protein
MNEGDKADTAARLMLVATKRGIIGRKRDEDASSMREAGPRLLEDCDWITRMLNDVVKQNKIEFIARRIDFQDVRLQKTESRIWFKGTSANARLVRIKPYPAADACYLAQALQHAALVAPEVAHGQPGERDMRVKPRNKSISGDRVLVVKVGESVREKLCAEKILERGHWQRPIPFPGKSRRPARVRESRHHDRRALELSARTSGPAGENRRLPKIRRFRKPDPTCPPTRAGQAVPAPQQQRRRCRDGWAYQFFDSKLEVALAYSLFNFLVFRARIFHAG